MSGRHQRLPGGQLPLDHFAPRAPWLQLDPDALAGSADPRGPRLANWWADCSRSTCTGGGLAGEENPPVSSLAALALLVAGVALVVAGADVFFRGLLALAARLRLPAFVVTVVLSGFELENLAAGIAANAKGLPGAAAGTFLGGTTFLAAGVAGLGALIAPMRSRLPLPALAWTAAAPLPLLLLARDGTLSRLDGGLLVLWFLVALAGLARSGRSLLAAEPGEARRRPVVLLLAGLGVLTLGGELLGEGLRKAVSHFGVSATLLGNTAVAASVEAEELARVAVPARRGRPDVALANVLGTIVHFIAFNAGVIALVQPLRLDDATLELHLPATLVATTTLCALLALREGLGRVEGAILLTLYGAYLALAVSGLGV
jgi:cation:H+ antiporter